MTAAGNADCTRRCRGPDIRYPQDAVPHHRREGYGQRVQKSVFECCIDKKDLRLLIHAITTVIDPHSDRVAIYRLREPYQRYVHTLGKGPDLDWRQPIIL